MEEIKHMGNPPAKTTEVLELLGKRVVSHDGIDVGKLDGIHVDSKALTIEGITVKKGFFKPRLYVGKDYIESINESGTVLKITPATELVGAPVYDSHGHKLGKVGEVERSRKTNNITGILIKRGLLKDDIHVGRNAIKETGNGIILNVTEKKLLEVVKAQEE